MKVGKIYQVRMGYSLVLTVNLGWHDHTTVFIPEKNKLLFLTVVQSRWRTDLFHCQSFWIEGCAVIKYNLYVEDFMMSLDHGSRTL